MIPAYGTQVRDADSLPERSTQGWVCEGWRFFVQIEHHHGYVEKSGLAGGGSIVVLDSHSYRVISVVRFPVQFGGGCDCGWKGYKLR